MRTKAEGRRQKADLLRASLLACGFVTAFMPWPTVAQQQEPMGRLFFTPAQRSSLDVARGQRARTGLATEPTAEQPSAPQEQTITYGGMVRRSDGKSTVWINGKPVTEREAVGSTAVVGRVGADGSVSVQNPQSGRSVSLKPGQSLELLSGTIEEGYTRKPVAPEAQPGAKPALDARNESKPDPAESARVAERERELQDLQRLRDAAQALRDSGALKPAPAAPPAPQFLQQRP